MEGSKYQAQGKRHKLIHSVRTGVKHTLKTKTSLRKSCNDNQYPNVENEGQIQD